MNTGFERNISRADAISRYLLSTVLLAAVMLFPATVPSWLALLACYPAFTALMQWDPINAFTTAVLNRLHKPMGNIATGNHAGLI